MSELRTRMDNDMLLRGMAEGTRESYIAAVARMARFYRRSPEKISEQEVQACLLHMMQARAPRTATPCCRRACWRSCGRTGGGIVRRCGSSRPGAAGPWM